MKNPIESYFRAHLAMCRDLIAEHSPRVALREIEQHWRALTDQYGDLGFERIRERALALTRQVFGGEAAPRMAHLSIDPVSAVEADCYAEQLAAEYWANGVRPSRDPAWRDKLNAKYSGMVERRLEQLARPARRPAPAAPNQKALINVREGPSGVLPAMHYLGVWRDGTDYLPGDVVSYKGTTWHCGLPSGSKPGTDSTWQMMAKNAR